MTKQICNIEQRGERFGCHTHKVQFAASEVIVEGKCPLGCEPNEIPPEKCPESSWHETHRYCPACSWREEPSVIELATARMDKANAERAAYIARLEKIALDADAYRCDGCGLVFDNDDGEHGEDCWLCHACAKELRAATS